MFASNTVMDVSPKRYGVGVRSLPPLDTLQPETLKDFTKEDLRCYLESAGLTPGITKPEMKRQMRSLINQATGVEDKYPQNKLINEQHSLINLADSAPHNFQIHNFQIHNFQIHNFQIHNFQIHNFLIHNSLIHNFRIRNFQCNQLHNFQCNHLLFHLYIPTPLPSPASVAGGSLPNFAEGDIQCSDCPKKGNKECHYKRCRTCCLRKMKELGYRCGPHLRDSDRRPTKITNFINSQPPGTPVTTPAYTPPPTPQPVLTRAPSTNAIMPPPPPRYPIPSLPPTPSTVVTPIQPVPTSSVPITMTSFTSSIPSSVAAPQPSHYVLPPPTLQPPSPPEPGEVSPYSVAECPRCHKVVSTLGANLWLHLKECDPDHIMDYVRLFHEGKLATPTLTEKEKLDPLRVAHQNAIQRYQQNIAYLQEIFSSTSVEDLLEWHAKLPSRESEQQRAVDTFTSAMEKMVAILDLNNDHQAIMQTFQERSAAFYTHLQLLDSCETMDDVATRALEFEQELNLRVHPAPAIVRVQVSKISNDSNSIDEAQAKGNNENGKHVSLYDKEMIDVSETTPLSLVAL